MVCAFQHLGMPNGLGWSLLHSASASGRLGGSRDVLVIEASANFGVQMFFQVVGHPTRQTLREEAYLAPDITEHGTHHACTRTYQTRTEGLPRIATEIV